MRGRYSVAVLMFAAVQAAGCASMDSAASLAGLLAGTCPPPQALSAAEQEKLAKFSAEVMKIIGQVAGADASEQVKAKAKSFYPVGQEAARIYALGHAACISCRTKAQNVPTCAEAFGQLIQVLTPRTRGEEDPPAVRAADSYSDAMLRGMLPASD